MAVTLRSPRPKSVKSQEPINRVFVDFENVPTVDLELIRNQAVEVTLLIGEKQRRLELGLVRQIHEHAAKVILIEVGASGRNALDLVLSWHLGRSAVLHPADPFFLISKDKDFDPLITHLRAQGLSVERLGAFSALPFLSTRRLTRKTQAERSPVLAPVADATSKSVQTSVGATASVAVVDERLKKIIDRLQHKTKARPVRRKTLLSHLNGFYGNQLSEPELEAIVAALQQRGVVAIDPRGRVEYLAGQS